MAHSLAGRSSSFRLWFSHDSPTLTMIFAILASLCITISHSSLYCFTSWRCNHQKIVKRNVRNTHIPHGERLKQETRDGGDKWEFGRYGAAPLENCK
ncbi:hypothetical protein V8E53_011329 [Lactarius tabidus]